MTCAKHTMFSPTKVSFVEVQNLVIDLRCCSPCNKFKRGSVSNKWWSADHGLLATDTLASLDVTFALITRLTSFLKSWTRNCDSECWRIPKGYAVFVI
jgi:hypothetical protein